MSIILYVLLSVAVYFFIKYQWLNHTFNKKLDEYKQNELNKDMEQYKFKCENDLLSFKQQASLMAQQEAQVKLEQWKIDEDKNIRKDAITKSQAVTLGKISEHLIPYFSEFNYNAKDARFMGSPVDLVVFDGLSEGNLKQIVFIEVKTGQSQLSQRERMIRDAISLGKVKWEEIRHAVEDKTDATMKRLGLSFGK
jgi:predicted Holliday junction resolvase-like endonuclease